MTNEQLRMQMLSGIITESEYVAIINKQIEEADKESLNESMIGRIVGIGAINQIPSRAKTDYELAYEHYLGERYEVKPNRERDDIKDINEEDTVEDMEARTAAEVNEDKLNTYTYTLLNKNDEEIEVEAKDMDEAGRKILSLYKGTDPMLTHVNGKLIDWKKSTF